MKHPDPKLQQRQEEFLRNCPEDQRAFSETGFRIGNAAYIYHQQSLSLSPKKLESYYQEWLQGLPANISSVMAEKGYEGCKTMFPFLRYVNEREDIGLTEWMKEHLSEEDFNYFKTSELPGAE